ncbi:MAG: DUF2937 family protein [Rhodospirillaceae bacterium]|nr:DUF2937 family protein [Rhodospirillaceae bacterium]MBT6090081.1 DUF2937 family protein [Rhodospirillaceae bacterium]
MDWLIQKLDMLIGAGLAAAAGMAASQVQAFINQYLQRLGGHLDEAKLNLDRIENGVRYQTMSNTVRQELEADASLRVNELQSAYDTISESGLLSRPFTFLNKADDGIIAGTLNDFVPALPLDTNALVYVCIGIVLALVAYEIIKLPITLVFGQPRRRKFRKRGVAD